MSSAGVVSSFLMASRRHFSKSTEFSLPVAAKLARTARLTSPFGAPTKSQFFRPTEVKTFSFV